MGWGLTTWLAFGRTVQLLGSLVASALHGYLTVQIHTKKLGLSKEMVVLELLACIILGYSIFTLILQRTSRRSQKKSWMTGFVVCDVVLCMALLGIINVLARAGLPDHCGGMTRKDFAAGEKPNLPKTGYSTVRFSDESNGRRGELDQFCNFERAYYVIANALIFTYMLTITATILRVLESKYTRNTKVNEMLESLERADDVNLKVLDSPPSPLGEMPNLNRPTPPSEGIITRNTSLRSTFTAATSVAGSQAAYTHHASRRPTGTIPRRPLPATSPASGASARPPSGFVPVPLNEDDDAAAAEAALVADGMQHHRRQHHHHQSIPPYHHHHSHHPSSSSSIPHSRHHMPMLSEEDHHHHHHGGHHSHGHSHDQDSADAALVSDGMRPSEPTLPPYHPGNRRMSGHGDDLDNEMRLSGYVKGQTRAQDMKDSGRF